MSPIWDEPYSRLKMAGKMTGSSTSAHRCCISEGVLSRRERRTLSPQWGVGTCLTAGLGSDPKPNKKALRVALTRCGTLSQNGYGTHMESLRQRSISEPPAGQKKSQPSRPGPGSDPGYWLSGRAILGVSGHAARQLVRPISRSPSNCPLREVLFLVA